MKNIPTLANVQLLKHLAQCFPDRTPFDATTIGFTREMHRPPGLDLMLAAGLRPRLYKRGAFSPGTKARLRLWFQKVANQDLGGFRLSRDRVGWYTIGPLAAARMSRHVRGVLSSAGRRLIPDPQGSDQSSNQTPGF